MIIEGKENKELRKINARIYENGQELEAEYDNLINGKGVESKEEILSRNEPILKNVKNLENDKKAKEQENNYVR